MANEFKVKNGLKVGDTTVIDSSGQVDWSSIKNKVNAVAASTNGLLSSSDKSKLDGIASNATVNQTITAGTGLSGGGSGASVTVNLSHLGLEGLSDPNGDKILFWDDSAGTVQWLDIGSSLNISGTSVSPVQASITANSATTTINFNTANNFYLTMSTNTTLSLSNASNNVGSTGMIILKQDATGGRSVTLPASMKTPLGGAAIVQETGANKTSCLSYYIAASDTILVNYIGDFA